VKVSDVLEGGPPSSAPAGTDDDELVALALAADPDAAVGDDAVCLWDLVDEDGPDLLPGWYMPAPAGAPAFRRGWRRRVALLLILAFLAIDAYGLCSTYGSVVVG
jgi:hypothetical protein